MKRICLVFALVSLWLGGLAFSAHGFTLLDDKLSISGYVQNQSSYRIGGDSDQWVSSENRLQVEMDAKLHPQVTVSGIFRGTYDAMYDLRNDSDQWRRDYGGSREVLSTEYKMRELYMDATLGKWDFRIGKQQVVWGETDGLRLMDIINPLDMRRQFVTRSWEDIRIPLTMVKAVYRINPRYNSYLELLWNPGDVGRDKIYFDTTLSNDYKSPWTISTPPLFEKMRVDMPFDVYYPSPGGPVGPIRITDALNRLDVPTLRKAGILNVAEEDTPAWINVNKSEFGARLGGESSGWFLTLNYWQGFSKSPVIKYEGGGILNVGDALGSPYVDPALSVPLNAAVAGYLSGFGYNALMQPFPINLRFEYPRERVIGFTFNKATGMWVWRGEFATYVDKHYNILGHGDDWSPYIGVLNNAFARGDMIAEKTMQASMLGFDYKRFITLLNPEKMFFISGQVFLHHIFDYEEDLRFGPYSQKPREDSYALSLLVNTEYHMGRICPEVLVVYDAAATGWYIKPRLEFKYGDHWRPEIGALVFTGDKNELPFGELNNNDEIYFRIKYQF